MLENKYMKKILELYKKYEEIINYLIIGGLTTVVNLATKYVLLFTIFSPTDSTELQVAVVISWIVACSFAYITNRKIVFKSNSEKIVKEVLSFFGARIFTLLLEMLIMFVFVTLLQMNSNAWVIVWSLVAQVVVTVVNYIFSKLVIFREK